MLDELTRLPDGRFITHNREILPSRPESVGLFERRRRHFDDQLAMFPDPYFDAVARAFKRSRVDEFGHWLSDFHANHVNGYAQIWVGPPVRLTKGLHVVAYHVFRDEITNGNHIDHLCRTRLCWFPEHLKQKSPGDNTRDGVRARYHKIQPPLPL